MNSILFIQSRRPHGELAGQEGLDALLMGSAFTRCGLLFLADGVLQIVRGQNTAGSGLKDYSASYGSLKDYGVTDVYCDADSLEHYHLDAADLVLEVTPQRKDEMAALVRQYDRVLNF